MGTWRFARRAPLMADSDIRTALRESLLEFAFEFGSNKPLREFASACREFPDLYIRINGAQFAYVHGWDLSADRKVATVRHFAVEPGAVRRGFGMALAEGFGGALKAEYGTRAILFAERNYSDSHESFFKNGLGASAMTRPLNPNVSDWLWPLR